MCSALRSPPIPSFSTTGENPILNDIAMQRINVHQHKNQVELTYTHKNILHYNTQAAFKQTACDLNETTRGGHNPKYHLVSSVKNGNTPPPQQPNNHENNTSSTPFLDNKNETSRERKSLVPIHSKERAEQKIIPRQTVQHNHGASVHTASCFSHIAAAG